MDQTTLFVPSKQASLIDSIDLKSYTKTNSLKLNSDQASLGMLMNIKVIDQTHLLAGYENGELQLFDVPSSNQLSCLDLFSGQPVMCFDYCKSKNFGAAGSAESSIQLFQIEDTKLIKTGEITLVNPGINCIRIRSDSKIFVTGGWDSRVRVYAVKKLNLLAVLSFHKEAINSIAFSQSNLMAVGSNDGIVSFWNLYN